MNRMERDQCLLREQPVFRSHLLRASEQVEQARVSVLVPHCPGTPYYRSPAHQGGTREVTQSVDLLLAVRPSVLMGG